MTNRQVTLAQAGIQNHQPDGRVDCGTNFAFGKRREP